MAQTFEDNNKVRNVKGLWSNPRTRSVLLIMAAVVLVMIVVGVFNRGGQQTVAEGTGSRSVNAPPVQARPGTVTDQQYQEAIRQENQRRLDAARQSGTTVLPTLDGPSNKASLDPLDNAQTPRPPQVTLPQPQPVVQPPQPQPVQPQPVQATKAPPAPQPVDPTRTARYKSVETQIGNYMKAWVAPNAMQEFAYNSMTADPNAPAANAGPSVAGASAPPSGAAPAPAAPPASSGTVRQGASFVRAGTIVPAVLRTSINSDTPGPVLAEIVSGPLAGARLLGSFQASEKQVVVQFRTLSIPGQPRSFSVNAYAVNEGLGTGLATDVNNHYFRRYGLLLAAGFLQGYGQAIGRAGTTTTITDGGGVIITQDELSDSKIAKVALGQAGTTIAGEVQQESRVKPTVKVEGKDNSGVPIGLLFMSDF